MADRTVGLVLAAGRGSRFGGGKLLASVAGRPILQHVLDAVAAAGVDDVVVVLGGDAGAIEAAIAWRDERRVINPVPEEGLATSLRLGIDAVDPAATEILVLLADQPAVRPEVIRRLLAVPLDDRRPIVIPIYPDDGDRHPVRVGRSAFGLFGEIAGDRGLGPLIDAHPDLVERIVVDGGNPDVDSRADLARILETAWADRVRANRAQVERIREVPDGSDFYAPVRSLFRADPDRTGDPVLDALRGLTRPGDAWLDVGAGAGRYALPIARSLEASGGRVVALDSSPSMLEALRDIALEHGIANVRTLEARWPPSDPLGLDGQPVDVALIAHVGYDIEAIGPFLDALEAVARRHCVAVLMERAPASVVDPFWPVVHGEDRVTLPALDDFLELLAARERPCRVIRHPIEGRGFETRSELEGFVRRQLWIAEDGPREAVFQAALDDLAEAGDAGWAIRDRPSNRVGIATWQPA